MENNKRPHLELEKMIKTSLIYLVLIINTGTGYCQIKHTRGKIKPLEEKTSYYGLDDSIIDRVFQLKELRDLTGEQQKLPVNKKDKIAIMLVQKPSKVDPNFYFKAGIDEYNLFLTIYHFRLNFRYRHMKVLDNFIFILEDSTERYIPLKVWRKYEETNRL